MLLWWRLLHNTGIMDHLIGLARRADAVAIHALAVGREGGSPTIYSGKLPRGSVSVRPLDFGFRTMFELERRPAQKSRQD
jgi:hypothetical protein